MSEKHTPGPWHVRSGGPHWNNPEIENHRIASSIKSLQTSDVAWSEDGELVAEHVYEVEDARLIAAAPELLQALEWALEHLDLLYPGARGDDALVDACVAAIAKATQP